MLPASQGHGAQARGMPGIHGDVQRAPAIPAGTTARRKAESPFPARARHCAGRRRALPPSQQPRGSEFRVPAVATPERARVSSAPPAGGEGGGAERVPGGRSAEARQLLPPAPPLLHELPVPADPLPPRPDLRVGYLANGLRYVVLEHPSPLGRFEAHLEVHSGSAGEGPAEQGIAHLVEHVTFLGSRKREALLGTGARSNAYTDFHHTVFHVHAPSGREEGSGDGEAGEAAAAAAAVASPAGAAFASAARGRGSGGAGDDDGPPASSLGMLPAVLDALVEIAFEPEMSQARLAKERLAVVSEAGMMNTIEYRVDCALLRRLHSENALGSRFPIGRVDQVPTWTREQVVGWWARHYAPANSTLYVVGDLDPDEAVECVQRAFDAVPAAPRLPRGVDPAAVCEAVARAGSDLALDTAAGASALPPPRVSAAGDPLPPRPTPQALGHEGFAGIVARDGAVRGVGVADPVRPPLHVSLVPGASRPPVEHVWGVGRVPYLGGDAAEGGEGAGAPGIAGSPAAGLLSLATLAPPGAPGAPPVPVTVFRHRLLQNFQLSVFCKTPVQAQRTSRDAAVAFCKRVLLAVWGFRLGVRYADGSDRFVSCELDVSDSGREGCAVSTLTVSSEPGDWRGAVAVAMEEAARMQRHGVTPGELERYKAALARDAAHLARGAANVPSSEVLDVLMETLALGSVALSAEQAHEAISRFVDGITVQDVNAVARSVLSFATHIGREGQLAAEFSDDPGAYAGPGPTVATSVVACVPAFCAAGGGAAPGTAAPHAGRGAGMATNHHDGDGAAVGGASDLALGADPPAVDPSAISSLAAELTGEAGGDDLGAAADAGEVPPPGAERFELSIDDLRAELCRDRSAGALPPDDVVTPSVLLSDDEIAGLLLETRPRFVDQEARAAEAALEAAAGAPGTAEGEAGGPAPALPGVPPGTPDPSTGIVRRRLSNGVRLTYRRTTNEPRAALLRVVAVGGRARERPGRGPRGVGSVGVGARILSESGAVGPWSRAHVELFCQSRLLNAVVDVDEEFGVVDAHVAVDDAGVPAALSLIHLLFAAPRWDEAAEARTKALYDAHARGVASSLERGTAERIVRAMFGPDRFFRDPTPEDVAALEMSAMREAVAEQFGPPDLELVAVGDFDPLELERAALKFLGTLSPGCGRALPGGTTPEAARGAAAAAPAPRAALLPAETEPRSVDLPIEFQHPPWNERHQAWHLADSDERACAYVAGRAPTRWGDTQGATVPRSDEVTPVPPVGDLLDPSRRRAHPAFRSVAMMALSEAVNSRLFTTVRDSLGLTYDVSFELSLFDRLPAAWFHVSVTSTPQSIGAALLASLRVLRGVHRQPITARELDRAKRTLISRHEADLKDNACWLGLLTHLQSDHVPAKDVSCIRDLGDLYAAITAEDVAAIAAEFDFSDDAVYSALGTSGPAEVAQPNPLADEARAGRAEGRGALAASPPPAKPSGAAPADRGALLDALRGLMGGGAR